MARRNGYRDVEIMEEDEARRRYFALATVRAKVFII
jgi:hypothetical protein